MSVFVLPHDRQCDDDEIFTSYNKKLVNNIDYMQLQFTLSIYTYFTIETTYMYKMVIHKMALSIIAMHEL